MTVQTIASSQAKPTTSPETRNHHRRGGEREGDGGRGEHEERLPLNALAPHTAAGIVRGVGPHVGGLPIGMSWAGRIPARLRGAERLARTSAALGLHGVSSGRGDEGTRVPGGAEFCANRAVVAAGGCDASVGNKVISNVLNRREYA